VSQGHAELAQQPLLAVEDAEEPAAEAGVDGRQQQQHGRHRRVQVPVRQRPAGLGVQAEPGLVRLAVAVEVGLPAGEDQDDGGRAGAGAERLRPALRVGGDPPEPVDLLGAVEHDQVDALGEARRGRVQRALEHRVDHLARRRPAIEAAYHPPPP